MTNNDNNTDANDTAPQNNTPVDELIANHSGMLMSSSDRAANIKNTNTAYTTHDDDAIRITVTVTHPDVTDGGSTVVASEPLTENGTPLSSWRDVHLTAEIAAVKVTHNVQDAVEQQSRSHNIINGTDDDDDDSTTNVNVNGE